MTEATTARTPTPLRRIAALLAPYKAKMLLVAAAVVAAALLTSVAPFLTRAVFDQALFPIDDGPADPRLLSWLVACRNPPSRSGPAARPAPGRPQRRRPSIGPGSRTAR